MNAFHELRFGVQIVRRAPLLIDVAVDAFDLLAR
jgi:hypothetical protein